MVFYATKLAFFGQKMRFFGDGGSEGAWVRGISPISVGLNPRITNGTLETLQESIKLLIVSKFVLTNPQRNFSFENSPPARVAIVFWLFCNGSQFSPHRVNNVFNAATTGQDWIDLGST